MRSVETTVTYLEMTCEHVHHLPSPARLKLMLLRVENITTDFYRFLYAAAGKGFERSNRSFLSDEELSLVIYAAGVEVWVVYGNGQPAGFFELAPAKCDTLALEYFGIASQFRGFGLGKWLLGEAIRAAWERKPRKLIVQTSTLDSPAALRLYQKMGFTPYDQKQETVIIPA